jgi:uncharacterized protein (DUF2249 family)
MIPTFETVPEEFDCAACMPGACGSRLLQRFDALQPLQAFALVAADDPTPLLRLLQSERPGRFEWSPLQEGPPAWRIEIARRDAREGAPREITEALEWDHDRLDRLQRSAFDAHAAGDCHSARTTFALFADGLRRHIGFEEALIFPEFERRTGIPAGAAPTTVLRAEHREILAFLDAIEPVIGEPGTIVEALRRSLNRLLTVHNRKEERVLYPVTDRVLAAAERNALVDRIQLFHEDGRRAT